MAKVIKMEETTSISIEIQPYVQYKKALRRIFLILCLFPILALMASIPTMAYSIFSSFYHTNLSSSSDVYYIFSFALPQILYPLFTLIAAFIILKITGNKRSDTFVFKDVHFIDVLLSIAVVLGMGTVGAYISDFITNMITQIGIPVPDMSEFITTPETPFQFCLYLISIAVLPAFCEEMVFRGCICGILKRYNKTAAIVVSSIAFSLMHATIQQIPFAFLMGLFLGYLYIKFDSLLPGILLHFVNNFISCILNVAYEDLAEQTYSLITNIYDIATIILGIVALIFFIIRRRRENNQNNDCDAPSIKGWNLCKHTLASWALWLFVLIYLFETAANILLLS